jgi:uncharacterized protein YegP (UPF0339 family)
MLSIVEQPTRGCAEVWQFDVYEDITGRYRWRLFAGNGRRAATASESFRASSEAHAAAARFKSHAGDGYDFQTYVDAGDNFRWRAKAADGQTVAASGEPYFSQRVAEAAAENVKAHAGGAELL